MHLADESMYRVKSRWTEPMEVFPQAPTPARRRDDKPKRRTAN
jgi:hypothetical protein